MARIDQTQLFGWNDIEILGDLQRLRLVVTYLPDEELVSALEQERGRGIDDYPVRPVWNSILAGVVFQHVSVESLRRELLRNGQLRQVCGFDLLKGVDAVPTAWAYSRFLKNLMKHQATVKGMFDELVEELMKALPDFGRTIAFDGKAIDSYARGKKKEEGEKKKEVDGRRDTDADWGKHVHSGVHEDGTVWEKVKSWFGYKLHLIVDARYELPIGFEVTKASASEVVEMHTLFEKVEGKHKEILERCDQAAGDKAYDDTKLIDKLWGTWQIKPVIDIRNLWKDGEQTKAVEGTGNVVYNYKGDVFCVCPSTGEQREMAYGGFEQDRESLKYRCPAKHYGYACAGAGTCGVGCAVRIPMAIDSRIFTPLARSSYAWERAYDSRTAVERVNSRLDVSFGFERHFIRGLEKMKVRCALALAVMLAMALGRVKENQQELMRSLVKTA
jgi:hypothetical protein